MIVIKDKTMHLIYSEDESLYYWQRLDTWETSQPFQTARASIVARQNNTLEWEE